MVAAIKSAPRDRRPLLACSTASRTTVPVRLNPRANADRSGRRHQIERERNHEIIRRQTFNCCSGSQDQVSLEEAFWNGLKEISGFRDMTLSELIDEINGDRQQGNLSSATRLFVLDYFKSRVGRGAPRP